MRVSRMGCCFVVDDVRATAQFYIEHFGFTEESGVDWFVNLVQESVGCELAFIKRGSQALPPGYRDQPVAGTQLGLVVVDARAEYQRLTAAGVPPLTEVTDEAFGQRHFFVADPNGVLIDVIELVEPEPDWQQRYGG